VCESYITKSNSHDMGIELAIKLHPSYVDNVLNKWVVEQYKSLERSLDARWADEDRRHEVSQMYGCLDKLVTSIV
jgi:hypothetical protein